MNNNANKSKLLQNHSELYKYFDPFIPNTARYSSYKYGVCKDRWGNNKIGYYKIENKELVFRGIICRRNGISNHCYSQLFKQMIDTDYPLQISIEKYEYIFSHICDCINNIVETLNNQPTKERQKKENSKFFIKYDRFIDICNTRSMTSNSTYYDGIHISQIDFPDLKIEKSLSSVEQLEIEYGSTSIEDEVYNSIEQRIRETNCCVTELINEILNR